MKRDKFVWMAILVAVPLLVLQLMYGVKVTAVDQGIPLLTILVMNEFGAVLCAIATWLSVNSLKNSENKSGSRPMLIAGIFIVVVLAFVFIWRLVMLYPTE